MLRSLPANFKFASKVSQWTLHQWCSIAIGFGVLVRVIQYAANRSLWADESVLALNIINRSYGELLQPLDYDQAAPIGFLMVLKLAVQTFGNNEYALRLFPLIGSILSFGLFYQVARRFLPKDAIFISVLLFISLEYLVYYASEVKQYSTDVTVALFAAYLFIKIIDRPIDLSRFILYALAGSIAIWFSHPAVFSLAGFGMLALIHTLQKRQTQKAIAIGAIGLSWGTSFLISYRVSLTAIRGNQNLQSHWSSAFPNSWLDVSWLLERINKFFGNPLGFDEGLLVDVAIGIFAIGCFALWKRNKFVLSLLLITPAFTLLAAYLQLYPFRYRLLLFLTPFVILIMGVGIAYLWEKARSRADWVKILAIIIIGAILVPPLFQTSRLVISPQKREEIVPVIEYIKANQQPGDLLYIFQRGIYQFKYYAPKYGYQPDDYIIGVEDLDDGEEVTPAERQQYLEEFERLRGNPRIWILMSHTDGVPEEQEFVVNYFQSIGKELDSFERTGAFVHLYDLT
ncbi:MAG: glycosyltransferase family 39 protein, partial [Cyanobacteriota bacterium]|nr:glycosyltransferase family 39 protein [Cyanobacteriota bacterium]